MSGEQFKYYLCGDSGAILARVSGLQYEYFDRLTETWRTDSYVMDHIVMGNAVEISEGDARTHMLTDRYLTLDERRRWQEHR
jgi:hypothetical protein